MSERRWNKALRPETITFVMIIVAVLAVIAVSSVWVVSSRRAQPTSSESRPFPSLIHKQLDSALDTIMKNADIPGAIVGVWVPGRGSWVATRGVADITTRKPVAPEDLVRIGSITKTFVATVVLQLVDEKVIGLDDPLAKYVTTVPGAGQITIRQLLNHTSGLFDFLDDESFERAILANPGRKWTPAELVGLSASHPLYFAPGTGWHYSNTGYILLGMIVESVTGDRLASEVDRRIIKPLGLTNTFFPNNADVAGPILTGYELVNGNLEKVPRFDPSIGWASSAMVSNLADMKIWARALAEGTLLSAQSQAERLKTIITGQDSPQYGLGILRNTDYTHDLLGHDGNAFGFTCASLYMPAEDSTVIVFLNRGVGDDLTAYRVASTFEGVVFQRRVP